MFRILGASTCLSPGNDTCAPRFYDNGISPIVVLERGFYNNGSCPLVALITRTSPFTWPSRQDITCPVSRPGTVAYRDIKLLNKIQPACLLGNCVLRAAEVTECSVI